ncbi:hypothetical protein [Actinoplanes sp. NPDC049118]|uniref:hypothetical protein n=1 Tax=Actinoplanes sp. NPDC049118 TaxID=3155769 RepID=UPI0033EE5062
MADVEELLDGVPVRLAPAQAVRARGERRRARRTGLVATAVVAATAVSIGSWLLPTPGPGGAGVPAGGTGVAAEGANPFMTDDVVRLRKPSDLPMYAALHWKIDYSKSESSDLVALPQAGLDGVCNGWPGGIQGPEQLLTGTYSGKGDARARYRVSQYAEVSQALDAIRGLGQTLRDCGLKENEAGARYSGRTNANGPWLDVSVRRWGAWVGVTEAQYSPAS